MEGGTDITTSAGPLGGETSTMTIATITIVVIVIIIIVIALIVIFMRAPPVATAPAYFIAPGTLGQPCSGDTQCTVGYRCQAGVCKAGLGTSCASLADCTGDAQDCRQGVCMAEPSGVLGGACPCALGYSCFNGVCKVAMGGPCTNVSDCTGQAQSCYYGQCSAAPPVSVSAVPTGPIVDSLAPPVNPVSQQDLLNALMVMSAMNRAPTTQPPAQTVAAVDQSAYSYTVQPGPQYVTKDYSPVTTMGEQIVQHNDDRSLNDALQDYNHVPDVQPDNHPDTQPDHAPSSSAVFGSKTLYRPIKPIASLGRTIANESTNVTLNQYRSTTHDQVDLVAHDVVYHRGDIIQLLSDRSIQVTNSRSIGKRYVSEFAITQMVSLGNNGTLGLGVDGNVYQQKTITAMSGSLYRWTLAGWAPKAIITMNTTHNNDYLWLQSSTHGHLYHIIQDPDQHRDPMLVEKVPMTNGNIRWYGNAKNEYVEYNPMTGQGTVMPGRQKITGAYRALVKPDGQAITAPPTVRRLRWVNGTVYYVMDR